MADRVLRKAVFLDRDGTIIRDENYLRDPARITMVPGAPAALKALRAEGRALVVITNQSGIARGLITESEHDAVRIAFEAALAAEGVTLDGYYFCPHGPEEGCPCRKPKTGLLDQASLDLHLDLRRSFMVGDRESDILAGKNAGCKTAFLSGGGPQLDYGADVCGSDWDALLQGILRHDL